MSSLSHGYPVLGMGLKADTGEIIFFVIFTLPASQANKIPVIHILTSFRGI